MLPEGWKNTIISEACELINGRGFKPHEWSRQGLPIIRIQNLNGSQEYNFYSGEFDKKILIQDGQLLFAWSGSKGTSFGPHIWNGPNGLLNYHTWKVLPKPSANILFLNQYFRYITSHIENKSHGASALVHTQKGEMENISILLPPLPEQKKIAAILSTWDRAIEGTEKLLANSQQQKKALMQQLLTGKKRLPGFTGEWENIALGELEKKGFLELGRGNVISKKDIAAHPGQNPIYSSSVKNCGLMGTCGHYMFDEELISWSIDGGGHFFHRKKHKFSITNVSGYMRVDQKNLNYKFLCSQLQFLHEKLHFDYQTKAHPSVIRDLYILNIPTLPEQKAIAAVLTTADEEITAIESDLSRLRQEKKALMQQLLTGKIRVAV